MFILFSVATKEDDMDDEEALIDAIRKINNLIKFLFNTISGNHWSLASKKYHKKFRNKLEEDVDVPVKNRYQLLTEKSHYLFLSPKSHTIYAHLR